MSNGIRWSFKWPEIDANGDPLPRSEIKHLFTQMSLNGGADYAPLAFVVPAPLPAPNAGEVFVPNMPPGVYLFKFSVVDIQNRPGATIEDSASIDRAAAPGTITELTLELTP
jgi:hypothetical protein